MVSKTRVLHLINRPQMRGAEMFAVRLADQLQGRGLENAICSLYPAEAEGDSRFDTAGLPTYELAVRKTVFDRLVRVEPLAVLRLRRVLKDVQPDVVIGHGSDTLKYASVARSLARRTRAAYVNIGVASHWANTRSRVWLNRFWLRNIDCAISVSEFAREDFVEHYGFDSSRTVFIPNAADARNFDEVADEAVRDQVREELGVTGDDIVIGMVGRFDPGKGQDTLVSATTELRSMGLPVQLVLVGDGMQREKIVAQAESAGITSNVHFLGVRDDVPRVMRAMDIFALPSLSEGMPGVLIEAGLSGLPSVAYDTGGVSEVLNHDSTGLVVPCGDYKQLVSALEGLCARPERRGQMGEQARAWCRARFDMDRVSAQYLQLIDQLLTGSSLTLSMPSENR